jgi:hypothetical protein
MGNIDLTTNSASPSATAAALLVTQVKSSVGARDRHGSIS